LASKTKTKKKKTKKKTDPRKTTHTKKKNKKGIGRATEWGKAVFREIFTRQCGQGVVVPVAGKKIRPRKKTSGAVEMDMTR